MRSKSFQSKLGTVSFDAGATAIQRFVFQRLQDGNWTTIVKIEKLRLYSTYFRQLQRLWLFHAQPKDVQT
jgi:hypothetical protein